MTREDAEIQQIARRQHGMISWGDVRGVGLRRRQIWRRVHSGEWVRELPDVWRLNWAEPTWMQKVWSASLRGGANAVISHRAAAWLWELDGVKLDAVDLSTPHRIHSTVNWFVPHRVASISSKMRRMRKGIQLTSPARTLVDVARFVGRDALQRMIEDACRRRIASVGELQRVLQLMPERGKAGTGRLSRLILEGIWEHGAQSELEYQAMRLFSEFGLPRPRRSYEVFEEDRWLAEVDFAWPKAKVIVEAEGFKFHSGRKDWADDIARYNSLVLHGWTVLRLTMDHFADGGEAFARSLKRALAASPARA
jgi:hypothetical protein